MENQISATPEALQQTVNDIASIDAKLSATNKNQGKQALLNSYSEKYTTSQELITKITNALDALGPEEKAVVVKSLVPQVKEYDKATNAFLDTQKNANVTELPAEEITALVEDRKAKLTLHSALRSILGFNGVDVSSIPTPKTRSGVRGKRTVKVPAFVVDSVPQPAGTNWSSVAEKVGLKTRDLKTQLKAQGYSGSGGSVSGAVNGHTIGVAPAAE